MNLKPLTGASSKSSIRNIGWLEVCITTDVSHAATLRAVAATVSPPRHIGHQLSQRRDVLAVALGGGGERADGLAITLYDLAVSLRSGGQRADGLAVLADGLAVALGGEEQGVDVAA